MTSRLSVARQTKQRDRPRSSDRLKGGRKRDGTPDKPGTPNASQDALQEEDPEALLKKNMIINDEILALQIKPEDLQKIHEPRPPSSERKRSPVVSSVVVRKLKPASERDRPRPKIVTVAKPAPPDAPLKPIDFLSAAGPRFDDTGNIIPHSILGSVEDFQRQAVLYGDLPADFATARGDDPGSLSVKYEKKKKADTYPKFMSTEQNNALKNWESKMMERKRQQGYLSKLLNVAPDQLVMNQADTYRQTQELRYIIDRTIPTMDYGKGYRVGSEFWKQQEQIGDELGGLQPNSKEQDTNNSNNTVLYMTLSQTEKGYPPPIEHIGVPRTVLTEKGTFCERPKTPLNKPWHKTAYLQERKKQLQPVIDELDPHFPELLELGIAGKTHQGLDRLGVTEQDRRGRGAHSDTGLTDTEEQRQEFLERQQDADMDIQQENLDPLREHPDVHPEPVFGPSLQFAGQPARWTGDAHSFSGQVGIEARVTFESFAAHRTTSYLEIINDGTTSIFYDWKRVPKTNPFEVMNARVQRFYFNTSSGVILPGDTMKFPFVFKSPNAGVFTEQWQLQTSPVVCGGAALVVTLRGVALQEDKFKKQRTELEKELAHKQAEQIVMGVLSGIIEGIRSPERPKSPVDAYITEEEQFSRKNPGLYYSSQRVEEARKLYLELFPEEEREEQQWDLSLADLEERIMALQEEDEEQLQQDLLHKLNHIVITMSFPAFTPKQQQMYNVGYEMMCEMTDALVGQASLLRNMLGMPEEEDIIPDQPRSSRLGKKRASGVSVSDSRRVSSHSTPTDSPSEGKRGGQKGKADAKDKKAGKEDKKPAKGGGKEKDTSKGGGKGASASKPSVAQPKERVHSPLSGTQSPAPPAGDTVLLAKFKDKLYTQAYITVCETLDQMGQVFGEIQSNQGGPRLPDM